VPDIENRDDDREHKSALPDSRGLQRRDRENRRFLRIVPVENDHQDLRAQQTTEGAVDREIGDEVAREAACSRESHGDPKSR